MSGESSAERLIRARKNLTAIFKRFQDVGQSTVAKELSVSDATVSNWKNKEAETVANMLAALGLKVVPAELDCYRPQTLGAILHLAKERLAQIESPEELAQELKWDGHE